MQSKENADNDTVHINLKITPKASKSEITGIKENRLCIRIAAQPESGKANECLSTYLSKMLNCTKRDITIIKGEHSRLKTVAIPAYQICALNPQIINIAAAINLTN